MLWGIVKYYVWFVGCCYAVARVVKVVVMTLLWYCRILWVVARVLLCSC